VNTTTSLGVVGTDCAGLKAWPLFVITLLSDFRAGEASSREALSRIAESCPTSSNGFGEAGWWGGAVEQPELAASDKNRIGNRERMGVLFKRE